jgi:hypothetical protein
MAKTIHLTEKENLHYLEVENITLDYKQDSSSHLTLHVCINVKRIRMCIYLILIFYRLLIEL